MNAAHTPGPWTVCAADWSDAGNARYELLNIKTVSALDARLIAAAPELLEACRAMSRYQNMVESGETRLLNAYAEAFEGAEAAIAKATGGAA